MAIAILLAAPGAGCSAAAGGQTEAPADHAKALEVERAARERYDAGDDEQAIALWREAVRLDPDLHSAWIGLAHSLIIAREIEEATRVVDTLVVRWPDDAHSWTGKGWLHLEQDELEDAVNAFNRALELDPGSIEARRGRLEALLRLGDCPRARTELNRLRRDARFQAERLQRRVAACASPEE